MVIHLAVLDIHYEQAHWCSWSYLGPRKCHFKQLHERRDQQVSTNGVYLLTFCHITLKLTENNRNKDPGHASKMVPNLWVVDHWRSARVKNMIHWKKNIIPLVIIYITKPNNHQLNNSKSQYLLHIIAF